jgi:hypothetical protein
MNPTTSRLALVASLCAMSIAVMGCTDAFTVHSIIEKPDEPGPPHNMYGLWVHQFDSESYAVLKIAPVAQAETGSARWPRCGFGKSLPLSRTPQCSKDVHASPRWRATRWWRSAP